MASNGSSLNPALGSLHSTPPIRPVVGFTTYLQQAQTGVWDVRASFLPAIYVDGVTMAGGIATLLPPRPVDDDIGGRVLGGLHGLVIPGGDDVHPATYGHRDHGDADEPARDRAMPIPAARNNCRPH